MLAKSGSRLHGFLGDFGAVFVVQHSPLKQDLAVDRSILISIGVMPR